MVKIAGGSCGILGTDQVTDLDFSSGAAEAAPQSGNPREIPDNLVTLLFTKTFRRKVCAPLPPRGFAPGAADQKPPSADG